MEPVTKLIHTRLAKGGVAKPTTVTFDFEGVTVEQIVELAVRGLVIAVQATYRTAGTVPEVEVVKVAAILAKTREAKPVTPEAMVARITKLPEAEQARIRELLREREVH